MKGLNVVVISGNVGPEPVSGASDRGPYGSFELAQSPRREAETTWVRVNFFGGRMARVCDDNLREGRYVIVEGELMNRRSGDRTLVEIRARDLIFC